MVGNYKVVTLCGSTRFRDAHGKNVRYLEEI